MQVIKENLFYFSSESFYSFHNAREIVKDPLKVKNDCERPSPLQLGNISW